MKAEKDNRLGSIRIPSAAIARLPVDGLRPTQRYRTRSSRSWSRRGMATRFKKRSVRGGSKAGSSSTRRLALRKRSS